jgi:hypothetical protein
MRGDRKTLGERRPIGLRERMEAAKFLVDRGWGKAVTVVELPDQPAGSNFTRVACASSDHRDR